MDSHSVPLVFYAIALIAIIIFVFNMKKFLVIRKGKEAPLDVKWWELLTNALTFGVAQKKVYRKRFSYASIMHTFIAWGFLELLFATTVDFFQARGWLTAYLPELDTPWFAFVNDFGGVALGIGLIMALIRRHGDKPEALPQDAWSGRGILLGDTGILVLLLLLVCGGFFAESARLAAENPESAMWSWAGFALTKILPESLWITAEPYLWWFHAITALIFIAWLPNTKIFHAIAVIANVAVTNRAKRNQIPAMHVSQLMEDPDLDPDTISLGVSSSSELTWKQLLNSISCTECARCTMVCPAYATDKPLSPMKIIGDVRNDIVNGIKNGGLVGGTITETELWSCTTCGACMEECPVLINHVPMITDFRRFLVLSEGKPPAQASQHLENIMNTGNPWGMSNRTKWATDADIELPLMATKKEADVLYWVGCAGAFDSRNQQVARSMVKIFEAASVDYAVLGDEEMCTGDSARRLGEEYLFETMALQNIETLNKYKFKKIVTACPHCLHTLKNEYGDFDGNYEVVHHTQFIQDLIANNKITVNSNESKQLTYHDPCYLGRYNGEYDAPREVLQSLLGSSEKMIEMKNHKSESFCCGAGGGNMWHEVEDGSRINLKRFDEAVETGAQGVVTSCSFCTIMMDDAMKVRGKEEDFSVQDLAELVADNLS